MKKFVRIFEKAAVRNVLSTVTVAALLAGSGCSDSKREEDGDAEPKLGFYRVNILVLEALNVNLRPDSGTISLAAFLSAECVGLAEFLPPDCDIHDPAWNYTVRFLAGVEGKVPLVTVNLIEPHSPSTAANIELNSQAILTRVRGGSLITPGIVPLLVEFFPRRVPKDLALSGARLVQINISVPTPAPPTAEEAANEASLRVFPLSQHTRLVGNQADPSTQPKIIYKGLATTISEITLSGGAGKFTLVSPTVGTALPDGARIPVTVQFQTDALDLSQHEAFLTISTANGKHNGITLSGRREAP